MRLHSILTVTLLLVALLSPVHSAELSQITRTEHFLIYHDPRIKTNAEVVGQACEAWLRDISKRLDIGTKPFAPIPVYLYRNQDEYKQATGHDAPGQILGRASTAGWVELDASGILAPAERIAGHEITHVIIFRILGSRVDRLPLWVNEGTAKYMSDGWDAVDHRILGDAVMDGTLIPLSALHTGFPKGERESLAYAQSTSAIRFLVKEHGEPALSRLIHATARTGSFDAAMHEVAGVSAAEFEKQWRVSVEGRISTARLMKIARLIGVIIWPLLIIFAYLAFRRRRRRIIERYEQEEYHEANWRDWGGRY